jgi:hypothetical protein
MLLITTLDTGRAVVSGSVTPLLGLNAALYRPVILLHSIV